MILLVEDDAIARLTFAKELRGHGYDVLEASDGAEAIASLTEHCDSIKLVVTDMVLPLVSGLKLIHRIQTSWPKIPVILVSAYFSQTAGIDILPDVSVLEKPVRPSGLIAAVQRILGQQQLS